MRDWTGNKSVRNTNIRSADAEPNDYYATEPRAVELLLQRETFSPTVWEPACGEGHISKVLAAHGYDVVSTDLVDRGYGIGGVDFLTAYYPQDGYNSDIITNPPYKYAKEFVERAMEVIQPGGKVAMFLKLTFLEGKARYRMFRKYPPKTVYVSSARLRCGKNGVFEGSAAVAYAWFVWVKGYDGETRLRLMLEEDADG